MGEITLLYEGMPELSPMLHRSSGLHVSEIITSLAIIHGYLDKDRELSTTWAELGNALEHAVVERYKIHDPGRYQRVGELQKDGISGTPDLIDTIDWAVDEIKLPWASSNWDIEDPKFWRYWAQVKAYCWMLPTQIGRLHLCHINGDYKWSEGAGPVYRVWEQRFTKEELAENWMVLKTHGDRMLREMNLGEPKEIDR